MFQDIYFTRMNERFRTAYNLAVMFLEQQAMLLAQGKRQSLAFVFDMNRLFEKFIENFLSRHKRSILGSITDQVFLKPQSSGMSVHLLQEEPSGEKKVRLRPDLLILDSLGRTQLIIDCKYKRLQNEEDFLQIAESDLYQMLSYLTRFNGQEALLVYPSQRGVDERRVSFRIPETNFRIHAATINLHQPLQDPDNLIREFQSLMKLAALHPFEEV